MAASILPKSNCSFLESVQFIEILILNMNIFCLKRNGGEMKEKKNPTYYGNLLLLLDVDTLEMLILLFKDFNNSPIDCARVQYSFICNKIFYV